jgi:hypothetical protein
MIADEAERSYRELSETYSSDQSVEWRHVLAAILGELA